MYAVSKLERAVEDCDTIMLTIIGYLKNICSVIEFGKII
jgi:hypothetical protein